VTLYLRIGEPTRLTTDSTRVSQVLHEPGQKSTRIEIYEKFSTQPGTNLWWTRLACGFQPIFTALHLTIIQLGCHYICLSRPMMTGYGLFMYHIW